MKVLPEIVIKGIEPTPYIDKLITRGIATLEEVCGYIISMRIALEKAQGRRQKGNPYRMRIDIRIPDRPDIIVKRLSTASKKTVDGLEQMPSQVGVQEQESEEPQPVRRAPLPRKRTRNEPLVALIRRTFDSARRELEKVVDRQRGEVKVHPEQQMQAVVESIFRSQGYGFLRTLEGEQVYFHRNSVLHNHWESLRVGTAVRHTLEIGDKGLQASTVEPVDKRGVAETHNELHDLPAIQ